MSKDFMNYPGMVQDALRGVVRQTLVRVAKGGLPGNHHLYLAFRTGHPGVQISDDLRARYPGEMTIVLQHQFWDLIVRDTEFEVSLSFNKIMEKLLIPFSALTGFFDPSVQFGLQFQPESATGEREEAPAPAPAVADRRDEAQPAAPTGEPEAGKVVTLDAFRKKS
ncbi:SspB family protein [Zavarzinia sp. CC-PAN008]|uniref:SspB family protein n=1 Tax=Zavarzinia sp. CC-PAN008 TaxID=3243332 RepID=UPI003F7432DD